jgi:hypothetical protein
MKPGEVLYEGAHPCMGGQGRSRPEHRSPRDGRPGLILFVQSFGDLVAFVGSPLQILCGASRRRR